MWHARVEHTQAPIVSHADSSDAYLPACSGRGSRIVLEALDSFELRTKNHLRAIDERERSDKVVVREQ